MLASSAVHHYHGAQENKKEIKKMKTALCSIIIAVLCEDKEVTRKECCKDWLHKQSENGSHATILHEL